MRITFILESFRRGGKERRCLQLIQGLNKRGYRDIQVIFINNSIEYPELYDTTAKVEVIDRKGKSLSFMETLRSVKRLIKDFDPDIVQAWGEASMLYAGIVRLTRKFAFICANVADCIRKNGTLYLV